VIKIAFDDDQRPEEGLVRLLERAAEFVAEREGIASACLEVSLFFAEQGEIRKLNADYRGIDEPTDVLSFPMREAEEGEPIKSTVPVIAPQLLGDVVICREIAEKQAEEYGHSEERELVFLFTHGLLHLLGYDHEGARADAEAMRAAEKEILAGLGLGG